MNYRKLIAPVVVTVLLLLYFGFALLGILNLPDSRGMGLLWVLIPLGLMGVSIFVLVERIREIRSGDEDDLGADGIINIRYASAAVMQGAAEIMVYGTAVKFI